MTNSAQHTIIVGCYAPADQPGIHALDFNTLTGSLMPRSSYTGIVNPSFLVVHPNGKWLYAVSETGLEGNGRYGSVHAFHINQQSLTLTPINHQSTNGDWPCHLQIDATGRWIFASNYGTGNVAVFPILEDGALGEMTAFVQHHGQGPNQARQERPHAHSTTLSPDNRFAIVADLGIDQLVIYKFDAETGRLSPHSQTETHAGAGPRHIAFHPDGDRMYVVNELDSTVSVYEYDAVNGKLHELQTLDTLPQNTPDSSDVPENIVADIHYSASHQRLYVSNRGHNSIAIYSVEENGRLTYLNNASCGGNWPRNFALAPNGRFMLVANRHSNEVSALPLLENNVEIGSPVKRATIAQPVCVQFLLNKR